MEISKQKNKNDKNASKTGKSHCFSLCQLAFKWSERWEAFAQLLSCLGAEIFLLDDLATTATWKFISHEMKSGITAYKNE